MPFPFYHIIFQSGAVFVVGFFLIFYLEDKFQDTLTSQKPSPLFPFLGGEDSGIKFLSKTKSFPSPEGIEGWVKRVKLALSVTTLNSSPITTN
ncbi:hypothetical protein A8B79_08120 [Balneola sp. EhC07]|nr:hypothetical protein A8B79_08120 [Balneola sp. EhC07]